MQEQFATTNNSLVEFLQSKGFGLSGWREFPGPQSWTFLSTPELRTHVRQFEITTRRATRSVSPNVIRTTADLLDALRV